MKLFVWDFHGVLEKDNELAVLEITNRVLAAHGHAVQLDEKTGRAYYGLKWYEYFERLLPDLTNEQHMALQAACFKLAEENLDILAKHIKPTDHAIDVLRSIHDAGHDQILLSNTRPHDLLWFVNTVGLTQYLPEPKIFGVNAHMKLGTKQEALKQYVDGKDFADIVIIGDSAKDMALRDVCGGTTYFYSHPHLKLGSAVRADFVITDLRKVLGEI